VIDERRRDDHPVADRAHDQAVAEAVARGRPCRLDLARNGAPAYALTSRLHARPSGPQVSTSPTSWVVPVSVRELLREVRAGARRAPCLDEAFALQQPDVRQAPPRRPPDARVR
jgi:hypothetical protein